MTATCCCSNTTSFGTVPVETDDPVTATLAIPLCYHCQGENLRSLLTHARYTANTADKSLARPRRKQDVRDARDFNNIETRDVIKFLFFLQGKASKEIHVMLTETLTRFIPGRAKDLSAPLYLTCSWQFIHYPLFNMNYSCIRHDKYRSPSKWGSVLLNCASSAATRIAFISIIYYG